VDAEDSYDEQTDSGQNEDQPMTIQDMLRWADPSILLKVYAHSRMDKRMEAQAKMIEAMGLTEKTARGLIQ
jgi:integrase